MRDRISFPCPACHARLKASIEFGGRSCPCPRCGQDVRVPPLVADEETPALVMDDGYRPSRWVNGIDLVTRRESR